MNLADVAKRDCRHGRGFLVIVKSRVEHGSSVLAGITGLGRGRRARGGALLPLFRSARWRPARLASAARVSPDVWELVSPATLAAATRATAAGTSSSRRGASSSRAAAPRG